MTIYEAEDPAMTDRIKHPSHYTRQGPECIQIMDMMVAGRPPEEAIRLGPTIKYLYRYGHKADAVEDLRKAAQYIEMLIEVVGQAQTTNVVDSRLDDPNGEYPR